MKKKTLQFYTVLLFAALLCSCNASNNTQNNDKSSNTLSSDMPKVTEKATVTEFSPEKTDDSFLDVEDTNEEALSQDIQNYS